MASKTRSAAAKKAWATRRKLYGASGVGKGKGPSKRSISNMKKSISKQRAAGIGVAKRGPRTEKEERAARMKAMTKRNKQAHKNAKKRGSKHFYMELHHGGVQHTKV